MLKPLRELVDFKKIIGDVVSRTVAGLLITAVLFLVAIGWAPTRNAIDDAVPLWLLAVGLLLEAAGLLGWNRYRARRTARSKRAPPILDEWLYEGVVWPLTAKLNYGGWVNRYEPGAPLCPKDRTSLGLILDEEDPEEKPWPVDSLWPNVQAEVLLFECFECHHRFDLRGTGYGATGLIHIVAEIALGKTRTANAELRR